VALLDRAIARLLPAVPRPLVQRISSRYIAGETVAEACRTVTQLNEQGRMATIDVLGEEISTPEAALEIVGAYHDVFEAIKSEHLDSNVSVKLTGLGLKLGYDLCKRNLQTVVRLCKGIYVEPPLIAYRDFDAVRKNFVLCLRELLRKGSYVGIATHDKWLISEGLRLVGEHGLKPEEYEFQMLLGVSAAAGDRLIREGHRLRVYVPFGKHWYSYSMRRLQENPKIAGYIAADTFGRVLGRNGA
jgi:proline dehydrogenase